MTIKLHLYSGIFMSAMKQRYLFDRKKVYIITEKIYKIMDS